MSNLKVFDPRPPCEPGTHNFHTGNAPCSLCGRYIHECGLSPGYKAVDPAALKLAGDVDDTAFSERLAALETDERFMLTNAQFIEHDDDDEQELLGPRKFLGTDIIGYDYEPKRVKQELLEPRGWNRADEVANLYGLVRAEGEDDDVLHTRIRRYVVAHPHAYKTPPPMDWTPDAPKMPKRVPIDTTKRVN